MSLESKKTVKMKELGKGKALFLCIKYRAVFCLALDHRLQVMIRRSVY